MNGEVTQPLRGLLRLEGAAVLLLSLIAYRYWGQGWGIFALCFLLPDVSFAAYLAGPRVGAIGYNAAHSYLGAAVCLGAGAVLGLPAFIAAGLIWSAHIGMDRALGYGLKYAQGFGHTHLGRIGRASDTTER